MTSSETNYCIGNKGLLFINILDTISEVYQYQLVHLSSFAPLNYRTMHLALLHRIFLNNIYKQHYVHWIHYQILRQGLRDTALLP